MLLLVLSNEAETTRIATVSRPMPWHATAEFELVFSELTHGSETSCCRNERGLRTTVDTKH